MCPGKSLEPRERLREMGKGLSLEKRGFRGDLVALTREGVRNEEQGERKQPQVAKGTFRLDIGNFPPGKGSGGIPMPGGISQPPHSMTP